MIKGCQKRMVVVRHPGGRYFEEAYFVLKKTAPIEPQHEGDMVSEANRILSETSLCLPECAERERDTPEERDFRSVTLALHWYTAGIATVMALLALVLIFL